MIEAKYYNKKIVDDYENRLQKVLDGIEKYSVLKNETAEDIGENKSIKRVFLTNQSKEDIFQRNNLIKKNKKRKCIF